MTIEINDRWTVATHFDAPPQVATRSLNGIITSEPDAMIGPFQSATFNDPSRNGNDKTTLDRVQEALHDCGYDQLRRIRTYCNHGRIVLQGRVATYYLKQVAQEVVLNVQGVRDVDNDLQVVCSR